jgi:hypothetical protein
VTCTRPVADVAPPNADADADARIRPMMAHDDDNLARFWGAHLAARAALLCAVAFVLTEAAQPYSYCNSVFR